MRKSLQTLLPTDRHRGHHSLAVLRSIFNYSFSYLKHIDLQLLQIGVLFKFRRAEKFEIF